MNGVIFQLLTVGSLFALSVFLWVSMRFGRDGTEDDGEILWDMRSERIGASKKKILESVE